MGSQASRRHGLTATRRGRGTHGDTPWAWAAAASSVWVSGSLSQSHSSLCLASLLSVSPLYPLLFFFFFYLGFFAFSVTPFGAECFVFFVFFLIDYLGHGLLGWGVHGSWIGRMMGWGGS